MPPNHQTALSNQGDYRLFNFELNQFESASKLTLNLHFLAHFVYESFLIRSISPFLLVCKQADIPPPVSPYASLVRPRPSDRRPRGSFSTLKNLSFDVNNNDWSLFHSSSDSNRANRSASTSSASSAVCPWPGESNRPEASTPNTFDLWSNLMLEEKRRQERQIQEDFELALRLSQEEGSNHGLGRR
jgi:hypothetical protein